MTSVLTEATPKQLLDGLLRVTSAPIDQDEEKLEGKAEPWLELLPTSVASTPTMAPDGSIGRSESVVARGSRGRH
jgi:hypothetical protein